VTAEAIVGLVIGGAGVVGWAVERARGMGRVEGKLDALATKVTEVATELANDRAEAIRSREAQGARIGNVESAIREMKAVDEDRSRPIRIDQRKGRDE